MLIARRSDSEIIENTSKIPSNLAGNFILDYPDTLEISMAGAPSTTVLPQNDANGVILKQIKPEFLRVYPSYEAVYYNPLLEASDLNFDRTALFPHANGSMPSRFKSGDTPNTFGLLPKNNAVGAGFMGVAITNQIDITALTPDGLGRETFLPYWRVVRKTFSEDVTPIESVHSRNIPAGVSYAESSSSLLKVYISGDNGNSYEELSRLTPYSFNQVTDNIRLAFVNEDTADFHILSYAILI